ncbi:branched-chain amino acid ABC transporter permease [Halobacterium noricense]|uniref:branched-chain amino acid ABC transporter permease n=1 Tax=Halobacterium noricense TaxID=223182 RepID=UPI001E57D594|nr:branched-chain amino acid ABC transporter permease [Halobacterium noricense]UHH23955.1 branched-chain amino acid ABC transporter permease [Halobacterium noricense]
MVNGISLVTNWLLLSALYALVAIGLTLLFGIAGMLNLGHGASIVIGAFSAYYVTNLGFSIWIGAAAAFVLPAVLNAVLYRGVVRKLETNSINQIILTLAITLLAHEIFYVLEGTVPKTIPSLVGGQTAILGQGVSKNRIAIFVLSWVIIGVVYYFVNHTRYGKAIKATGMTTKGASLSGINHEHINLVIWLIAGGLAGLAGLFLGSFQNVVYNMWESPLLLSFGIVILGGIGSVRGSIIAAYIIGFLEVFVITMVNTRLAGLASFAVLALVMLVRPEGLFGREFTEA